MIYLMIPVSFVVGAVLGGLLVSHFRARGDGPAPLVRRQKLKLIASTALGTILFLGLSGYAAFRYKFRSKPLKRASTKKAVKDYREAAGASAGDPSSKGLPPGGVYTYLTRGGLKVKSALLGNTNRPLPPSIPAVLIHKKNCWELTLRMYDKQRRTERYCRTKTGIKLVERWEKNVLFGIDTFTRQTVGPHELLGPTGKVGSAWLDTWKVVKHTTSMPLPIKRPDMDLHITYVERKPLDIGGQPVMAHHLQHEATYGGPISGVMTRHLWYDVSTGMLLKLTNDSQGSGAATMTINRQFTLASLTPKK